MPTHTFESEEEAAAFLSARLAERLSVPPSRVAPVAQNWSAAVKEQAPVPPGATPAMVKRFRWVIRDDDLQLADALADCAKTGITSGGSILLGSPDAAALAALTGGLASLFKLGRRANRKGKVLDARSFALLLALRADGPLTLPALTFHLSAQDPSWTADEASTKLKELAAVVLGDGTQQALVAEDAQGRWRTVGI